MGSEEDKKSNDFYEVLGLKKECTSVDLRNAYRKLAMKWHPDRCSGSGNSKFVEEAKKKFQNIQEAYAVLSDETKRFLYDVGVYDNLDDDNNQGMGEFLNEMAAMMSENKHSENGEETFEQLQVLFDEMFQTGHEAFSSTSSTSCSSSYFASSDASFFNNGNKRSLSEMNNPRGSSSQVQGFCVGAQQYKSDATHGSSPNGGSLQGADSSSHNNGGNNSRRRQGQKQKLSSGHDVSSSDFRGIST